LTGFAAFWRLEILFAVKHCVRAKVPLTDVPAARFVRQGRDGSTIDLSVPHLRRDLCRYGILVMMGNFLS
jgi:hypothetical protein